MMAYLLHPGHVSHLSQHKNISLLMGIIMRVLQKPGMAPKIFMFNFDAGF